MQVSFSELSFESSSSTSPPDARRHDDCCFSLVHKYCQSAMEGTKTDFCDVFLISPSCLLITTSCEGVSFVRVCHAGVRGEVSQWI